MKKRPWAKALLITILLNSLLLIQLPEAVQQRRPVLAKKGQDARVQVQLITKQQSQTKVQNKPQRNAVTEKQPADNNLKKEQKDSVAHFQKALSRSQKHSLNQYLYTVLKKIEANKRYPKSAKRKGQGGQITCSFIIQKNGQIKSLKLSDPSQYESLNNAALSAIESASPFPEIPRSLALKEYAISLQLDFQLSKRN